MCSAEEERTSLLRQRGHVLRRKGEAVPVRVVFHVPGVGHATQPFAGIACVDSRELGQLLARHGAVLGQILEETQSVTQCGQHGGHGRAVVLHHLADEGFDSLLVEGFFPLHGRASFLAGIDRVAPPKERILRE